MNISLIWKANCIYLDYLIVYSHSVKEHASHVREVLKRLQKVGFTLNPEKLTIGAVEIKYLGHMLSSRGIRVLPELLPSRTTPVPLTLGRWEDLSTWRVFMPGLLRIIHGVLPCCMLSKEKGAVHLDRSTPNGVSVTQTGALWGPTPSDPRFW